MTDRNEIGQGIVEAIDWLIGSGHISDIIELAKRVETDYDKHTCGECGYWAEVNRLIANGKVYGSTNTYFEKISGCKNGDRGSRCQACPDFIPRTKVPHG